MVELFFKILPVENTTAHAHASHLTHDRANFIP
jgi:hypothetical protein